MFPETSTSTIILLLVAALVTIPVVGYIWSRRWLYYYASKLEGPFAFPLIGSAYRFLGGQEVFLDKMMGVVDEYHSGTNTVSKLWMGNVLYVIVTDPRDIELFLTKFLEKGDAYKFGKEAFGDGLLVAPVEIWKGHRKVVTQAFNLKILESFLDIFDTYANAIVAKMEEGCSDVFPLLFQASLNMTCETSMGVQPEDISGSSQYMKWVIKGQSLVTCRFFRLWLHPDAIWRLTSMSKEFSEMCTNIWNYAGEIVAKKRQQKTSEICYLPERKIFLDHLLDNSESTKWKDRDLMAQIQAIVFGAGETTALVQSFALIMLAMHQDVQDKVFDEIREVFGGDKRIPTVADLNRKYAMWAMKTVLAKILSQYQVTSTDYRSVEDIKLGISVMIKATNGYKVTIKRRQV